MRQSLIALFALAIMWAVSYPLAMTYNDDDSDANSVFTILGLIGFFLLPYVIGITLVVVLVIGAVRLIRQAGSRR